MKAADTTFYILHGSEGYTIRYKDSNLELTRQNLDMCIAELREDPSCPEIKIPEDIEKLLKP